MIWKLFYSQIISSNYRNNIAFLKKDSSNLNSNHILIVLYRTKYISKFEKTSIICWRCISPFNSSSDVILEQWNIKISSNGAIIVVGSRKGGRLWNTWNQFRLIVKRALSDNVFTLTSYKFVKEIRYGRLSPSRNERTLLFVCFNNLCSKMRSTFQTMLFINNSTTGESFDDCCNNVHILFAVNCSISWISILGDKLLLHKWTRFMELFESTFHELVRLWMITATHRSQNHSIRIVQINN